MSSGFSSIGTFKGQSGFSSATSFCCLLPRFASKQLVQSRPQRNTCGNERVDVGPMTGTSTIRSGSLIPRAGRGPTARTSKFSLLF